jgi:hypothetical protein
LNTIFGALGLGVGVAGPVVCAFIARAATKTIRQVKIPFFIFLSFEGFKINVFLL